MKLKKLLTTFLLIIGINTLASDLSNKEKTVLVLEKAFNKNQDRSVLKYVNDKTVNIEKLIIQAENCGAITTKKERYDARKVLDVFKTRASKSNLILELDDKIKSCEPKLT